MKKMDSQCGSVVTTRLHQGRKMKKKKIKNEGGGVRAHQVQPRWRVSFFATACHTNANLRFVVRLQLWGWACGTACGGLPWIGVIILPKTGVYGVEKKTNEGQLEGFIHFRKGEVFHVYAC